MGTPPRTMWSHFLPTFAPVGAATATAEPVVEPVVEPVPVVSVEPVATEVAPAPPDPDAAHVAFGHWFGPWGGRASHVDVPPSTATLASTEGDTTDTLTVDDDGATGTRATTTTDGDTETVDESSVIVGDSSLAVSGSQRTTTGDTSEVSSGSITANDGGVVVSGTNSTETGDDSTSTTDTLTAGDGSIGATTSTTVKDGDDTVTTGGNVALDGDGAMTVGTSYDENGNGTSGNVTVNADGTVENASGTITRKSGDNSGSATLTVNDDGVTVGGSGTVGGTTLGGSVTSDGNTTTVNANANVKAGGISAGFTYANTSSGPASSLVLDDQGSPISNMVGGPSYTKATRSDRTTLGGNVGFKGMGAAANMTSGSTMEVFSALPANWDTMTPEERGQYQIDQGAADTTQLGTISGLADVDLTQMGEGDGVHYASYNGWNASAGVTYGAVSVTGGGGQSSVNDVTVMNRDGMFEVSMIRQDGLNTEAGLAIAGVGLNGSTQTTDQHEFKFQVDPKNPEAMAAMQTFMQTGLLPGADKMTSEEDQLASTNFAEARTQVDALNGEVAVIQAQMAEPGYDPNDPANAAAQQALAEKYRQLDTAQHNLQLNRDFLNDNWQAQYGSNVGQGPMAGVTVMATTDTHAETLTTGVDTPVGDFELGRNERTWVDQQYLDAQGNPEERFMFNDEVYLFGNLQEQQSVQTATDPDAPVLQMYSDNEAVVSENATIISNIENSDIPSYVVDGFEREGKNFDDLWNDPIYENLSGRTTVSLDAQQLNAMTTSMNDMSNPESVALWGDLSTRTSQFMAGGDWTKKTGDEDIDHMFLEGQQHERTAWLAEIQDRDATDPLQQAIASYGGETPEASMQLASAQFATIQTPADFQKLTFDQQQLYIAVIQQTSGANHDLTGQTSQYESMGAISLLHDESAPEQDAAVRAESMRDLFVSTNDAEKDDYSDGVYEFVQFTERFKTSDPATYALLQEGISFDWSQPNVEGIVADNTPDEITAEFTDSSSDGRGDGMKEFELIQAASQQGGSAQVTTMLQQSGADPTTLLADLDDPLRQHMMYDILVAAGYGAGIDPSVLKFEP